MIAVDVSDLNQANWTRRRIVREYRDASYEWPGETAIYRTLGASGATGPDRSVLDLGCGGGRTTPTLSALFGSYLGIDYSPDMIRLAQIRNPGAQFTVGDARKLEVPDSSVDFLLFSFNGIDTSSAADRGLILREAWRTLKPGGHFAFSTHNRDFVDLDQLRRPSLPRLSLAPLRAAREVTRYARSHWNRWRRRRFEVEMTDHALITERGSDFAYLIHYSSLSAQVTQLLEARFTRITAFGAEGELLPLDQPYRADWMMHLLCRKPG